MKSRAHLSYVTLLVMFACHFSYGQGTPPNNPKPSDLIGASKAITTAVPFLAITPDARHAALGDAGAASSADPNAAFWNAGKLVFIDGKSYGGSLSYTPWLGKIINDMWISQLSGFYKIRQEETVGVSFKYFDLGDISFRDIYNNPMGDFNPKEASLDATYSRMLSQNLSVGLTARYIYSNLTGAFSGNDAQAGNTAAMDIGVFYTKPLQKSTRNSTVSFGAQISNIGPKISYTDDANKDFLPTNLRVGGAFTTQLDAFNSITFLLDLNKLMVPTPDSTDAGRSKTVLSGMFNSFGDAPGGGSEEIQELMTSLGIEYWYRDIFAARAGYFLEAKEKGDRKYMTAGVGFRKNNFGIDVAYIVPTNRREHPLAETIRFTILMQIPQQELIEESVTD